MNTGPLEPCKAMCATCPFRAGSPYEFLRSELTMSALTQATRICHNTGPRNAVISRPKGKARACRGARNKQLEYFVGLGFLKEPTDECWTAKLKEIQDARR